MDHDGAISFLAKKFKGKPAVFIIYTNALGDFPDILEDAVTIPCENVPCFPRKKYECISPSLIFGKRKNTNILVLKGRYHEHDGYSVDEIVFPVKIAHLLGCSYMLVTCAAGAVDDTYQLGDLMMVQDHVSFTEEKNVTVPKMYDETFLVSSRKLAVEEGMEKHVKFGTYAMIGTLDHQTSLEKLRNLSFNSVGTSVVREVITASEMGMKSFGVNIMTDKGILDRDKTYPPTPEEISEAIEPKKSFIEKLLKEYIEHCK